MDTAVQQEQAAILRVSYGRREGRGALGDQGPVSHIAWPDEFTVRWWTKDTRNHRYLRADLEDENRGTFQPNCTLSSFVIPARWAFRSELSQDLDENRDKARDCRTCFRARR